MKKISILVTAMAMSLSGNTQIVARYNFNGGAANDISGNGHNGTLSATGVTAAAGQAGIPGTALQFNGTSGYIQVPASTSLDLHTWTITAKVKFSKFYSGLCQGNRIVNHGTEFGNDYYAIEVHDNYYDNDCTVFSPTHEQYGGQAAGSASGVYVPTATIQTNVWYCFTTTYGNDTLKSYVNGVLDDIEYWPDQYTGYPSGAPLYIGKASGSNPYYVNGIIDEVAIWKDVKTQSQIDSFCKITDTPCVVKDIQFCSSVSTPFKYTFTPVVTPTSALVLWNFGDGSPSVYATGSVSVQHTFPTTGGSYNICLTVLAPDSSSCSHPYCFPMCLSQVGAKGSEQNPTGRLSQSNNDLTASVGDPYPNPANSILNIPITGYSGRLVTTILGIDGTRISTISSSLSESKNLLQLSTQNLKPGTYLLEINFGETKVTKRFSKF